MSLLTRTWLSDPIQHELVLQVTREEPIESEIGNNGTFIDHCAVGATDVDLSLESAPPGGNGTGTDLQALNLKEIPLLPL